MHFDQKQGKFIGDPGGKAPALGVTPAPKSEPKKATAKLKEIAAKVAPLFKF